MEHGAEVRLGEVVSANITKSHELGAFAKIDDSIEGLIHISELAGYRINHPRNRSGRRRGSSADIRIDPERRRRGAQPEASSEERTWKLIGGKRQSPDWVRTEAELANRQLEAALGTLQPKMD